ncbi:MAG TPA: class I SAM-dependent methyltransferase, partial [Solirubrobacteraceae bacterium]|nr:class I SAM-dependent methyltransferase [Solirubrobacteraceae bacterium]
ARRGDTVLPDPLAVALTETIDHPFAERFGETALLAQWQALRAKRFDIEIRRFLAAHPDGTVVALGEGLETQFWRVDNGRMRWLTVDVPETIELRDRLLGLADRQAAFAGSAFEAAWMDDVDPGNGVLVTAQGLFMYFDLTEVERLIAALRARFPGGWLLFDAVPKWQAARSRKPRSDGGYRPPPWLWGMDRHRRRALGAAKLRLPRGRGIFGVLPLSAVEILRVRL